MVIIGVVGLPKSGKSTICSVLAQKGFSTCYGPLLTSTDVKMLLNKYEEDSCIQGTINVNLLKQLIKKNHFIIVQVKSCFKTRFQRAQLGWQEFSQIDKSAQQAVRSQFQLAQPKFFIQNQDSLAVLNQKVSRLIQNIKSQQKSQHIFFMKLAQSLRAKSNCMKTSIGAVIVKDQIVVACGYNGTLNKIECNKGGCQRCNKGNKMGQNISRCECIHAQEMAIFNCQRQNIKGSKIYTTVFPCFSCTKHIILTGISQIIYEHDYTGSEESLKILRDMKIKATQFVFSPISI